MVEFSEFKGKKIIVLKNKEDDKFPFQFGLGKAKMIVANYEAIKNFVEDNDEVRPETKDTQA